MRNAIEVGSAVTYVDDGYNEHSATVREVGEPGESGQPALSLFVDGSVIQTVPNAADMVGGTRHWKPAPRVKKASRLRPARKSRRAKR